MPEIKFDGMMLLTLVGLAAVGGVVYFAKKNSGAVVAAINPMNSNNLINKNDNMYWSGNGIFDIEVIYNPGINPDTKTQQEVMLRSTITLEKT